MKKILIVLITTLLFVACKTSEISINTDDVYGSSMINVYEKTYTLAQFDSICVADNISNNLKDWYAFSSREGRYGQTVQEYLYIKSLGENEVIYRVEKLGSNTYKVTKRITK